MFDRIVRILFPAQESGVLPNHQVDDPYQSIDYDDERIPGPARERVRMILARLVEVETSLRREAAADSSTIDAERIRDVHLPRLIRSYIDIPAEHRSEIFRRTGRSASFVLVDSLDQMLRHLEAILRDFANHDIDAFNTNIRFIAQRFSDGGDPFS